MFSRSIHNLSRYEPWLVLAAGPPLVLREWFAGRWPGLVGQGATPGPLEWLALGWIGLLWAARYVQRGRWTVPTALDVPIVALLVTLPGAIAVAMDPAASVSRAESLIFAIAVYYAMANAVDSPARAWSAASWLLVAAMGLVAVGLVSVGWIEKYPALTPVLSRLPRLIQQVPHANPDLQKVGVHPNTLGVLLAMFVPLAVTLLLWPAGTRGGAELQPPGYLRRVAQLSLLLVVPVLLLTQSRASWLALAVALWVLAALRRRQLWILTGSAAVTAVVLGGLIGVPRLLAYWQEGALPLATSAAGRIRLWREAAALLAQRPTTGIGLNNFPLVHGYRPEYQGHFVFQGAAHAHNVLIQSALDYGIPGFVAVAALAATVGWCTYRAHRRLVGTPLDPLVLGLAGGLLVYALHGLVDAMAIGAKTGFVVWAMAGVLAGVRARGHRWVELPGSRMAVGQVPRQPETRVIPCRQLPAPAAIGRRR